MDPNRHGFIFVAIVLLPLLATSVTLLRWTTGESIDERLTRLAYFNAGAIVLLDIALMVAMFDPNRKEKAEYAEKERTEGKL